MKKLRYLPDVTQGISEINTIQSQTSMLEIVRWLELLDTHVSYSEHKWPNSHTKGPFG